MSIEFSHREIEDETKKSQDKNILKFKSYTLL